MLQNVFMAVHDGLQVKERFGHWPSRGSSWFKGAAYGGVGYCQPGFWTQPLRSTRLMPAMPLQHQREPLSCDTFQPIEEPVK